MLHVPPFQPSLVGLVHLSSLVNLLLAARTQQLGSKVGRRQPKPLQAARLVIAPSRPVPICFGKVSTP